MKPKLPLVVVAVVGVILIVTIRMLTGGSSTATGSNGPATTAPQFRGGCIAVTVAASSEKAALLTKIAKGYTADAQVQGKCVDVHVFTAASGAAEQALAHGWDEKVNGPAPTVWSPAASTWVGLLRGDLAKADKPGIVPDEVSSVAATPLVIAMPEPMAKALGWPKKNIGWTEMTQLANHPDGWASAGHPEWGRFTLGKTNPTLSTSGLAATVGTLVAATGRSSDLTAADLADPKVRQFAADAERAVLHYGDTTLTYLANLQRADDAGSGLGYVSAVAVEEKSVLDYNLGNPTGDPATLGDHKAPRVPLVGIHPREGTLMSDNPWVVLNAEWVTDEQKAAARDFETYLHTDASQKVFTDAGFRTADGQAGAPLQASAYLNDGPVEVVLSPPSAQVLDGVRAAWKDLRKKARVLLLMDVSGSMGEMVGSAGQTKLELAQEAALGALDEFSDADEVGVWSFTTEMGSDGKQVTAPMAEIAPIGTQRAAIEKAVSRLTPLGGTPLYAATRKATQEMAAGLDPSKINAVVLLTDGRNEYPQDNNLDGLLDALGDGSVEAKLRVFSIAYGEGADLATLSKISNASGAKAYDATNPANIAAVFTAVLSNF